MKRTYPATSAGLKRLHRDLERTVKPIRVPVQAVPVPASVGYPIPPQPPAPTSEIHHHYGSMVTVSVSGNNHAVAVGDHAQAQLVGGGEDDLLARLRDVVARLDDLELDDESRDEVHDAVEAAERIGASGNDDQHGLVRRATRVLQVLGQVAASPGANALAEALAEPIQQLLT